MIVLAIRSDTSARNASSAGGALGGAAEHVVLVGEADFCLFYKHPKVTQITGPDWMVKLAELANEV